MSTISPIAPTHSLAPYPRRLASIPMYDALPTYATGHLAGSGLSRTENCVEYWNSPVPSTMTSIPYPESVFCCPAGKSQGTCHTYSAGKAGMASTIALGSSAHVLELPRQRTKLTFTPSVGWPVGSHVILKSSPLIRGCSRSGKRSAPQVGVSRGLV